jgi:hypothetical protein
VRASGGRERVLPVPEVVAFTEGQIESDGVRYALIRSHTEPPLVFDTRRGRRFRPAAPEPDCSYPAIGGGLAVWSCPSRTVITNLATGRSRQPAGIEQIEAMTGPHYHCGPLDIGRAWLAFSCGASLGPQDEVFLNHRTGRIADLSRVNRDRRHPYLVDLNHDELVRYICRPLQGRGLTAFSPPFGLWSDDDLRSDAPGLWLRRCGRERQETVSRCSSALCVTPQLGTRYVTWGRDDGVFAYLPRLRRRVLIGRASEEINAYGAVRFVAHTCNRVFAQWAYTVYVARFEPRRGAPPCQANR